MLWNNPRRTDEARTLWACTAFPKAKKEKSNKVVTTEVFLLWTGYGLHPILSGWSRKWKLRLGALLAIEYSLDVQVHRRNSIYSRLQSYCCSLSLGFAQVPKCHSSRYVALSPQHSANAPLRLSSEYGSVCLDMVTTTVSGQSWTEIQPYCRADGLYRVEVVYDWLHGWKQRIR